VGRLRFGRFEADLVVAELRKNGLRVKLPGQAFEVLVALRKVTQTLQKLVMGSALMPDANPAICADGGPAVVSFPYTFQ
jgi:hypothetical protein